MKILYYSPNPLLNLSKPTGYGTHMREMIGAFNELGHTVYPVIMGGVKLDTNTIKNSAMEQLFKQTIKGLTPNYIWETLKDYNLLKSDQNFEKTLQDKVEEIEPDLIYERANYMQLSGVKVANACHVPHVLEINAPYVEERSILSSKSWLEEKASHIEKKQLELTDNVVVVSTALQQYFSEKHGIKQNKFIVTPNAINPKHIKFDKVEVERIKQKYNLVGKTIIGFVGAIMKWHSVDILLKAFSEVVRYRSDVKLLIVGNGFILPHLEQLAVELKLGEHVVFTGEVPHSQVFNFIQVMDIGVLANSHWYGSPVKIFEYGAMEKAIVAPDNVPVKDVMVDGQDGLLIKPNEKQISQTMMRLIDDSSYRQQLALSFKEKVLGEHTWIDNASRVIAKM